MRTLLVLLLAAIAVNAQERYNLAALSELFEQNHPQAKNHALLEQSTENTLKLSTATDAAELALATAYADENGGDNGLEYTLSLSKTMFLPPYSGKLESAARLQLQSQLLESKRQLQTQTFAIASLYHQSCVQAETITLYQQFKEQIEALNTVNQKAYELGEISKKDLIIWHLQLHRATQQLHQSRAKYKTLFRTLQSKLGNNPKIEALACDDLYAMELPALPYSVEDNLELHALKLRKESVSTAAAARDTWLKSLSLTGGYDKELGTERYNIGISMPLGGTGRASLEAQAARSEAMMLENTIADTAQRKRKELHAIYAQLKYHLDMHTTLQGPISEDSVMLFELEESAYKTGEASAMEMVTIQREIIDILMQTQEEKANFYTTLFEYYTQAGKEKQ